MTSRKPEELIVEFLDRVWGPEHDLNAIDELMTTDYIITTGGRMIKGRVAFKEWVAQFQKLLPDARTVNQEAFSNAAGDRAMSRWICTGKNNGIFGLPPDGRPVSFTGISIWKIRDGKLAECWVERSALESYKELSSKP
jgi:predicted ester cyclase